jgi:hypothetical protein
MNHRIVLSLIAAIIVGGATVPAFAATGAGNGEPQAVCVTGSNQPGGPGQGICVWVSLPFGPR